MAAMGLIHPEKCGEKNEEILRLHCFHNIRARLVAHQALQLPAWSGSLKCWVTSGHEYLGILEGGVSWVFSLFDT